MKAEQTRNGVMSSPEQEMGGATTARSAARTQRAIAAALNTPEPRCACGIVVAVPGYRAVELSHRDDEMAPPRRRVLNRVDVDADSCGRATTSPWATDR
jgi:hypothetical protein